MVVTLTVSSLDLIDNTVRLTDANTRMPSAAYPRGTSHTICCRPRNTLDLFLDSQEQHHQPQLTSIKSSPYQHHNVAMGLQRGKQPRAGT